MSQEQPTTLPIVPIYGYVGRIVYDQDGNPVIAVNITRAKDVEYAQGVTLETQLVSTQELITSMQAQIADLVLHVQDISLFLTERFGYEYKNHAAADAFVPLFENVDKVPSTDGQPIEG